MGSVLGTNQIASKLRVKNESTELTGSLLQDTYRNEDRVIHP